MSRVDSAATGYPLPDRLVGQMVSDAHAATIRDFVARRRQSHSWPPLYSGCCVNCDRRLKEDARCSRCGQPFLEADERCNDPEADAALEALDALA